MTALEMFKYFRDKYSMKELYEGGKVYNDVCQFHSSVPFYGCITRYLGQSDKFNIVETLDYDESTDTINCLGWVCIGDVETADKKLSKLLEQVHEYEKHYKNKVEIKRLKKMHHDF